MKIVYTCFAFAFIYLIKLKIGPTLLTGSASSSNSFRKYLIVEEYFLHRLFDKDEHYLFVLILCKHLFTNLLLTILCTNCYYCE